MKQQHGGTFLGFILGLVVGLGIALAVAIYVTKVPIPFVNKSHTRTPEQDAAEARKNKDWDPNAPLYGKNPARPAASAASAPAAGASASAEKPDAKTEGKPEVRPEAKPAAGADPLGDLARAKAGAPAAAEPFIYFVQLGAFRSPEDAESQRAKLSLAGVEAKVLEREQSGRSIYRVRVGPFERREDADRTKDKLEAAGYDTVVVRSQR